MDSELLKDSVEALECLRAELHGNVEDSVIQRLDEVIWELEIAQEAYPDRCTAEFVLNLFGLVLEHLPEIVVSLDVLRRLVENTPNH